MSNVTITQTNKGKKIDNIVFVVLCVMIAILLVVNIVVVSMAYFTDSASNNSIITTGNVNVVAVVRDSNSSKVQSIRLDDDTLMPGSETINTIAIYNNGKNDCYLRLSCEFRLEISSVYTISDVVTMGINTSAPNQSSFKKNTTDKKVYYLESLAPNTSVQVPVKFIVDQNFGNSQGGIDYTGMNYRIVVTIEAYQTAGITLNTTTPAWSDTETGLSI